VAYSSNNRCKSDDLLEIHHVDGKHQNHQWGNLTLLHQHCHDQVHSGMHDKHPLVEEPMKRKCAPWHALIELPTELAGVQGN
jgi:hypothetical protein